MTHTAEEVREHAQFLREYMLNGIADPAPELRWKHQDKIAAMLTAYAADLERREAGVTDEMAATVAQWLHEEYGVLPPVGPLRRMIQAALLPVGTKLYLAPATPESDGSVS